MNTMTVKDWKTLERHPLSAMYEDLEGHQWRVFKERLSKHGILNQRAVTLSEGKVLDGWQLQRACVELNIEPAYKELPEGVTAEEYVEALNDLRRHETKETAEKRIRERQERVAKARQDGKSLRAIAEEEGVSRQTVLNDVEAAAVNGLTVQPKDGVVIGKNGQPYEPVKPVIVQVPAPPPEAKQPEPAPPIAPVTPAPSALAATTCPRCQRNLFMGLTVVPGCPMCLELAKKVKAALQPPKPASVSAPKAPPVDTWLHDAISTIVQVQQLLKDANLSEGMRKRAKKWPGVNAQKFLTDNEFVENGLANILTQLKAVKP